MSTPSPAIGNLARQLLAGESAGADPSIPDLGKAILACHKLRVALVKLAGAAGFSSLLSRALALGKRQAPSLGRLRVQPDGMLVESETQGPESAAAADAEQGGSGREGEILVTELLNLLVMFIGEPLTLSLVREAWPHLPIETITVSHKETP